MYLICVNLALVFHYNVKIITINILLQSVSMIVEIITINIILQSASMISKSPIKHDYPGHSEFYCCCIICLGEILFLHPLNIVLDGSRSTCTCMYIGQKYQYIFCVSCYRVNSAWASASALFYSKSPYQGMSRGREHALLVLLFRKIRISMSMV